MTHIFTSVVNRPDFIILQNKLFQKFLKNKYQFHIIDDAIDSEISNWHSNWRGSEDPLANKTKIFNKIMKSILS